MVLETGRGMQASFSRREAISDLSAPKRSGSGRVIGSFSLRAAARFRDAASCDDHRHKNRCD